MTVRNILLAFFDALRDLDLSFTAQQRHTAHLFEIEPNRIVGPAECAGSEIDLLLVLFRCFSFSSSAPAPASTSASSASSLAAFGVPGFPDAFPFGCIHNLNVHFAKHRHDLLNWSEETTSAGNVLFRSSYVRKPFSFPINELLHFAE